MIPEHRTRYNAAFTTAKYQEMMADIDQQFPGQLDFRVAETPVFIPADLRNKLIAAGDSIIDVIQQNNFKELTEAAIPPHQRVPGNEGRPDFLTFDFAVCRNTAGNLEPQLIEMQGFPSLYAFQAWLPGVFGSHFPISGSVSAFLNSPDAAGYLEEMRGFLLGNEVPENVILLEIYPDKQKTRIYFVITKYFWGI